MGTLRDGVACVKSFDQQGRTIDQTCSGGSSTFDDLFWPPLLIALVVASITTTMYLALRLRRSNRRAVLA